MDRQNFIGGSDAIRIMNGDWEKLYLEKIGELQPEDLSENLAVQLGIFTEPFNIDWFIQRHQPGFDIGKTKINRQVTTNIYTIDGVPCKGSFDGLMTQNELKKEWILECKHTNPFTKLEEIVERYMPQVQFYMMLHRHQQAMKPIRNRVETCGCFLSILHGNSKHSSPHIEYSGSYVEELMDRIKCFWNEHVVPRVKPSGNPIEETPSIDSIVIDRKVKKDMRNSNEFTSDAYDYVQTMAEAIKHEQAKKKLLNYMQEDWAEAYNDYLTIKVSKTGRRTIKIKEKANGQTE
tara:strand:+ start:59 stop:931 length:873 start_codon:yes stop_codon:yes gene_type:complete